MISDSLCPCLAVTTYTTYETYIFLLSFSLTLIPFPQLLFLSPLSFSISKCSRPFTPILFFPCLTPSISPQRPARSISPLLDPLLPGYEGRWELSLQVVAYHSCSFHPRPDVLLSLLPFLCSLLFIDFLHNLYPVLSAIYIRHDFTPMEFF